MNITFPSGYERSFDQGPMIMGILNVTPDSFSDGGEYNSKEKAVERGMELFENGAEMVDIGGESTRPGASPVPYEEERDRTIPVIERLRAKTDLPISIDTRKPKLARKALEAGADLINDVGGLQDHNEMAQVVAEYEVPVVAMHMQGRPETMQDDPSYDEVIEDILDYLRRSKELAKEAGLSDEQIILDPGIGFGKSLEHNCMILREIERFHELNSPILVGTSRKSFIGQLNGEDDPGERVEGSLASIARPALEGVQIFRVHDVQSTKSFLDVLLSLC